MTARLREPLNQLANPVYPDIRMSGPRFYNSGKHWTVDPGMVLREEEHNTQLHEGAVLAVSRDIQNKYGQSSHKEIVNAEFRPPTIEPYELYAHHLYPARAVSIETRINPGTAHDSGGYRARNGDINNVESHLTDRIANTGVRPTYYKSMYSAPDDTLMPELGYVNPNVSATAGINTDVTIEGYMALEDLQLDDVNPNVSATAGINTTYTADGEMALQDLQLEEIAGRNRVFHTGKKTTFTADQREFDNAEDYTREERTVSYAVPGESTYKDGGNRMMDGPNVRTKLAPLKSFGQISQSGTNYSTVNTNVMRGVLADSFRTVGIKKKNLNSTRRSKYRF